MSQNEYRQKLMAQLKSTLLFTYILSFLNKREWQTTKRTNAAIKLVFLQYNGFQAGTTAEY